MPRKSYALSKPRDFSVIDAGTGKALPGAAIPVVCERIRHYRMKIGMGRMVFASAVQVSGNAISNWETGRTRPDISLIPAICEALGISPCQLFEMQDPGRDYSEEEQHLVSLYRGLSAGNRRALRLLAGSLKDAQLGDACPDITVLRLMEKGLAAGTGDPSEFEEHSRPIYLYSSPLISRADYVFPVSGDSMEPEYRDGDLVLVQAIPEGPELQHGETGAFIKGNEQFIKVYEEKGLRSLNPNYPFMNFSDTDETVYLIGRVIGTVDRERDLADDGDAEKYLRIHDGL